MTGSSATTPPTDYELKRRAIIEGAAEVFAEKGFVAGTTKDIAARVGLSQPAIYHYAETKEDLLTEIALRVEADMQRALREALETDGDDIVKLVSFVHRFTAAVIANQLTFAVYYKEMHQLSPDLRDRIRDAEGEFVAGVRGLVQNVQDQGGLLEAASPTVVTEAIVGMISWVYRWYRADGPLSAAEIADTFVKVIGLAPDLAE